MKNTFRIVLFSSATFVATALFPLKDALGAELCRDVLIEQHDITAEVKAYDASQRYSQKIRDNTEDYWDFSRKYSSPVFDLLKKHVGLIAGDNHAGNFIFGSLNGKLSYFLADIKDSGRAPYVYDIARLVVNTDAVVSKSLDIKFKLLAKTILDSYILGLEGKQIPVPISMAPAFSTSRETFITSYREYIDGKVKKGHLKIKPGKLELIPDTPEMKKSVSDMTDFLKKEFPNAEIIDFAIRPKERGGSKERLRFWSLIKENGLYDIIEFKEVGPPATAKYRRQDAPEHRYEEIMETFWPDRDPFYQLIHLANKPFETRRKKVDVMSVPYKQKTPQDLQLLMDMASYAANHTGQLHAKTLPDGEYLAEVKKLMPDFIEELKSFKKSYKLHLETEIMTINEPVLREVGEE
jgi:Uncharacterized protein conserved in bacteria (DUF2252).